MDTKSGKIWDVIVIGGGPAGMMAAARAGERGRAVLLVEKNLELGKKLAITGGGRCNVTNNKTDVRTMLARYKESGKFLFSTFTQHGVADTITWFKKRGVDFVEENEGRLFPETKSAETIREALISELQKQKVEVCLKAGVKDMVYDSAKSLFAIQLLGGEVLTGKACIVATGGTSRPETGSTGEGFGWLSALGHMVKENNFALVPVVIKDKWVSRVSGVVLNDIKITLLADEKKQKSQTGKILFTHAGVSGPTILNMSSQIGDLLTHSTVILKLDLFPKLDEAAFRTLLNEHLSESSNRKVRNVLADLLPKALATIILGLLAIDGETPGHSLRSEDRTKLVLFLKNLPLTVKSLLGADKAVISGGGVALTEVDFKTMRSKIIPNLYLVGDVLDIDRPSGGYSLQLCWSTGYVAGNNA